MRALDFRRNQREHQTLKSGFEVWRGQRKRKKKKSRQWVAGGGAGEGGGHRTLKSQLLEVQCSNGLPLFLGGLGLRSASRTSTPAFWTSWADCLGMNPDVAAHLVRQLEGHPHTPSLEAAASAARSFRGVQGFEPLRPAPRQPDEFEPGCERSGWQHEVASGVEERAEMATSSPD